MGEAGSSRRAKANFGNFVFSVCAAALGAALFFAAGNHLFGPTVGAGIAQPLAAGIGEAAAASYRSGGPLPAHDNAPSKRYHKLAVARPFRRALRVTVGSQRFQRNAAAPQGTAVRIARIAPAAPDARAVRAHGRSAPRVHAVGKATVAHNHAARFAPVARAPGTVTAPVPARARSASHRVRGKVVARATTGAARSGSLALTPRAVNRARAMRERAIIEPPLGYEAQPPLVVAPAAAALDLGTPALPSIRSRRRH